MVKKGVLKKIDDYRWELPQDYKPGMHVPGLIYADEEMLGQILQDQALEQVANVATLPGIIGCSMAMPDIHWGYGFAIGGVAAMRREGGVVSPGGVGFDINCGVRMLHTNLTVEEVRPRLEELANALFRNIPAGLGSEGRLRIDNREMNKVLERGARWAVEKGYGLSEDLELSEEEGGIRWANPEAVGPRPRQRGFPQLGTLGSGNHFLEVQEVVEIYRPQVAEAFGISGVGQITVMIHCGSRGLGHQVCEDYLKVMNTAIQKYSISLSDRQLACAPLDSPEANAYLGAMAAAANYAWANRQCLAHWTRETFMKVLSKGPRDLGMRMVYDVAHNMAKIEEHDYQGKKVTVCVHRKGATRSFPPGHPAIPAVYSQVGQPVLIPGDMGRYSFLAVGTETALKETWGSTCHGAGRRQSRAAAKRDLRGVDIAEELAQKGIIVRATSRAELAEEASVAYKDVAQVVNITDKAGLSLKVAKMRPLAVIKG